jgi:Zn-dependent protease
MGGFYNRISIAASHTHPRNPTMLLTEPPPSPGDLHFRVFGIPVRVHPFFWLVTVIMGLNTGEDGTPPAELLIWVAVVFVSILVHELGHAFLQRRFGGRPWITLHGIGGLASCDDCDRGPRSQILISLAGPAAGFLLAAIMVAMIRLSGHVIGIAREGGIPFEQLRVDSVPVVSLFGFNLYWAPFASMGANTLMHNMLFVNIIWGLVNLLPVYPLDGGRISRELCTIKNPRRGIILSLQVSIVTAILMAAIGLLVWQSFYTALMFGYLAYVNYQTFQAYRENRW